MFYRIFYSLDRFDTVGKFSILREYVLRMDLMHSGNLIILYTMSRCIPSYGVHCLSRNTPQIPQIFEETGGLDLGGFSGPLDRE